jgi:hypothetical protein
LTKAQLKSLRIGDWVIYNSLAQRVFDKAGEVLKLEHACDGVHYSECKKVLCETCEADITEVGAAYKRCHNCIEIESRLECYLKSQKGYQFVQRSLREAKL